MYALLLQAFRPMLQPGVRAIRAVLAQLYPLPTKLAEHTARLNLAKERVRSQHRSALVGIPSARLMHAWEIARVVLSECSSEGPRRV